MQSKTRVVAFGVFDGLHPGHIYFLQQAKELGDELFVVVTRDHTAEREKGRPRLNEDERCELVNALKIVDRAVLGDTIESYGNVIRELQPDIIAVGYDQKRNDTAIRSVRLNAYEPHRCHTSKIKAS
ncbi:MAG: adenylyltransferase/cytidyltransferase family protein [Candidatus Uhrbacteria bacterium]